MATYGLTSTGFLLKTIDVIQAEIQSDMQNAFGQSVNLFPTSFIGQLVGIFAQREALLWQQQQAIYLSQFPDTATGQSLDNAVGITGIKRLAATFSTTTLRVMGTLGTFVPSTFRASSPTSTTVFQATQPGTIGAGINQQNLLAFSAVPTSGNFQIAYGGQTSTSLTYSVDAPTLQAALQAMTSIGSGNVTVTGNQTTGFTLAFAGTLGQKEIPPSGFSIPANTLVGTSGAVTLTFSVVQKGYLPYVDLPASATVAGALPAPSGTVTAIATPTFGVTAVINTVDAVIGRNRETDSQLRQRRITQLSKTGTATVAGLVSSILAITNVQRVYLVENATNNTDGAGRPAHSFETFVQGGDQTAIANAIFAAKPAGIQTVGTVSVNITDTQGNAQTVNFSRPIAINIYVKVALGKNTDPTQGALFPTNGLALVQSAILAFTQNYQVGQPVVASQLYTPINTVPGITSISLTLGTSPNPTGTSNIPVPATSLAILPSTNLTVS